jgi:mono/diheme cytochrome c family protein
VWYTTSGTRHDRLSRFEVDPINPARALPGTEQILINQRDEAGNHNGGELLFGPDDGYLYLSVGDEGGSAALDNLQRIDNNLFSGIIRLDVDKRPGSIPANPHPANTNIGSGTINYAIPPDNPFIGISNFNSAPVNPNSVRTEFWAVGLRNPWRMSFDPQTRLLYCGDVGSTDTEEVNIIVRGGNYGWNYFEGTNRTGGLTPPAGFAPIWPIHLYNRLGGPPLCVIGGIVYRGNRYSDLWGTYLFADHLNGNIWSMRCELSGGVTNIMPPVQIASSQYISSFGVHPASGEILLASQLDQQIKRLVRTSSSGPSLPPTLADTGAFSDLANLTPQPGIVPYDLNVPFWSDHARKMRWFSVPNTNLVIGFDPTNNWAFPTGSVWIKHFDLELTNGVPASARRLETRFIVRNESGVYGLTYRWGNSLTNATLVQDEGTNESFVIHEGGGILRTQVWRYPSRSECLQCHTPRAGLVAGFNTPQLNRTLDYGGSPENQLLALSQAGYFSAPVDDAETLPALAPATNVAFSVEHRVRSYLAANCVQCHQPGGTAQGLWDARFSTPMSQARIIDGLLLDDLGNPANRVIKPGSIDQSVLLQRLANFGSRHMPPLATSVLNQEAIDLVTAWTMSLAEPQITIDSASFVGNSFHLTASGDPGVVYTLETSTNLTSWMPITTAVSAPDGKVELTDTNAAAFTFRFYRVALGP